jgi:superfamily I DNA/RNA helicase
LLDAITQLVDQRQLVDVLDAILLDEAQDYWPEEIELFLRIGKVIFAVADSRQKIYPGDDPLAFLAQKLGPPHTLRYHYRNGRDVCRVADALAKDRKAHEPLKDTSNYDENARPSRVQVFRKSTLAEQGAEIVKQLELQLKAYPGEILGVVAPRHEELTVVWDHIANAALPAKAVYQRSSDEPVEFDSDMRICVCTLHSAKGIEFRALHVAGCEFLSHFPHQRNMAFTAVTRAKTSLSIYHCSDLPGYLEAALAALRETDAVPDLERIFEGGSNVD